MNSKTIIGLVSGAVGALSALEIGNFILLVLSIIGILLSLVVSVWNIIEKLKKAIKNDGVIDDTERKEILDEVVKASEEIIEKTNNLKQK